MQRKSHCLLRNELYCNAPPMSVLPRLLLCTTAIGLAIATTQNLSAQEVQSRPGIALIKPQAWSKIDESVPMEFLAFTDRTVKGAPGAGYYELKTKQSDKRQIAASKVVKFVVYPDLNLYPEIVTPEDRAEVAYIAEELQGVIKQYPATRTYLDSHLKEVNAELALFDSGKIKRGGQWQAKETVVASQITTLGAQLKVDILKAHPAASFDLENDPHFVALKEMSGKSESAKALVQELQDVHKKRLQADVRDDLIKRLGENNLGLPEAEGAVARLRTLKPEEDPKSAAFLKKWDADTAVVKAASEKAKPIAEAIEVEFTPLEEVTTPPELTKETTAQAAGLSDDLRTFAASNPTPVILLEARQPMAVYRISEALKKLKSLFEEKRLLEAKDVLDSVTDKADAIGEHTVKVMTGLQSQVTKKIEEFTRTREEAQLLQSNGKQKEALAKFEAAYELVNDPSVGEQISILKQSLPPEPAN